MAFVSILATSRYYIFTFFVASVGQPKSVLTRYLGTLLDFQTYELLDFIL